MNMRRSLCFFGALLLTAHVAWADCAPGFYSKTVSAFRHVIGRFCVPNGRTATTAPGSLVAGPLLAAWIEESRNSAYGAAQPIPRDMRFMLEHWVEPDVLSRARYKIGDDGVANLGRLVNVYGDVDAVTLIDLIVFHDARAAADPGTWAHELFHVRQFRDMGALNFAMGYVANYRGLEDPAYASQADYYPWVENRPLPQALWSSISLHRSRRHAQRPTALCLAVLRLGSHSNAEPEGHLAEINLSGRARLSDE
jgi:hypothetical protein